MADATVIKEFLVSLGFKTDEKSLKKFSDGIAGATKEVTKLVTAITGAALAVSAGVAAFASNLEDLYFASKRSGASATNIKAMQSAFRDFGVSAGETQGALEGLANFMRNTPGGEGFLQNLGVNTRDAKGHLLDTSEILVNLSRRFQALQKTNPYIAHQYAQLLGLSQNMELAMKDPGFESSFRKYQASLKNANLEAATKKAHALGIKLNELKNRFMAFADRAEEAILEKVIPALEKFSGWWDKNGAVISKRADDILHILLRIGEDAAPALGKLLDKLIELDKRTDGWSSKLIVLGLLFGPLVMRIGKVAAAFWALTKAARAASAAEAAAAGAGGAAGAAAAGGAAAGGAAAAESRMPAVFRGRGAQAIMGGAEGAAVGGSVSWLSRLLPWVRSLGGVAMMLHSSDLNSGEDVAMDAMRAREKARKQAPHGKEAPRKQVSTSLLQRVMRFFEQQGWSHNQAAGIVGNLIKESGLRIHAVGDNGQAYGIAQWHKDRQEAFAKWAGHDIRHSTLREQLGFIQYELTRGGDTQARLAGLLLRASRNAAFSGRVISHFYERPKDDYGTKADERGKTAVQIAQETNIHIHGVQEPHVAGKVAANEQSRINERLVRNLPGAYQ